MYKKIIIGFLVLIIFIGVASAEDNLTAVGDDAVHESFIEDGKDFNEIKESIDKANDSDTIKANGTYHASKDHIMTIDKSLTIEGTDSAVFDCEDNVLHISSSKSLTLKNIRFTNIDLQGKVDNVISSSGELRIINCTFDSIVAGGLLLNGHSAVVEDCVIENGVYSGDMIISQNHYSNECYFTLKNSTIINSMASHLLNIANSESTIISDNLIYNNTFRQNLITSEDYRYYDKRIENKKFTFTGNALASNLNDDLAVPKITIDPAYVSMGLSSYIALTTVVKDNFWGRNIYDPLEFTVLKYITYDTYDQKWEKSITWCNVELEKINDTSYRLSYVNSNGQKVNLKGPAFNIIDKQNSEVLASNVNIGVFNTTKNINISNVYIETIEGIIINKDPAKIVYTVTGNTYNDLKVKMTLYDPYTDLPLAGEYVRFDIRGLWSETGDTADNYYRVHTGSDGSKICDGESETPGQYYLYGFIHGPYELYTFKTTFTSEDYGFTQESVTVKIKKPVLNVILNPVTATYGSSKSVKINVKDAETNMDISSTFLVAKIYKGKKLMKEYDLYVNKGTATFKISKLDAGSYTIRFTCFDDEKTMKDKSVKLTVNKKKLSVKAAKVTAKYKKSKTFKIILKNAGKASVKVKLKIGKKVYKVKTDKKGVAKFNTKKLKIGTYKVTITSNDENYKFSAKSMITVKR